MNIYSNATATERIYSDGKDWTRSVWGKYEPRVDITDVRKEDLDAMLEYCTYRAKKAQTLEEMSKFAGYGVQLKTVWAEAERKAAAENAEAEAKAAEHRAEDAAEAAETAAEDAND